MKFGWKVLIPVALVWVVIVSVARLFRNDVNLSNTALLLVGAVVIVVLLGGSWLLQIRANRKEDRRAQAEEDNARRVNEVLTGAATGHPVPPLPGQRFEYTPRRATVTSPAIARDSADDSAKEEGTDA